MARPETRHRKRTALRGVCTEVQREENREEEAQSEERETTSHLSHVCVSSVLELIT